MLDSPFRAFLPQITGPLMALYQRLHLTPNHVTLLGFICALGAAWFVALGNAWGGVSLWWLGRLFDGTDGIYARHRGQVTAFGGYLDIVVDMASYGAMIIGFSLWRPDLNLNWLIVMFLYVLCITTALAYGGIERAKGLGAMDNRTLKLATGLAEGGETGLAYTAFLVAPEALPALVNIWIFILTITVVARSWLAWRTVGRQKTSAR